MKIFKLTLKENGITRTDTFVEKNLIHSTENSKGKTTYLRLLMFSLGYSVPQTSRINFQKIETEVDFETRRGVFKASRSGNVLILWKDDRKINTYILPNEHILFLKEIFNCTNDYILKNLLGVMYIDQEKGWTLINRGSVVGRIKFNIEELIAGLDDINIDEEIEKRNRLDKEIAKYKALINIKEYQNELSSQPVSEDIRTAINQKNKELSINNFRLQTLKNEMKEIDEALRNEKNIIESILSLGIEFNDGRVVRKIERRDIKNLEKYEEDLEFRRRLIKGQIVNIQNRNNLLFKEKAQVLNPDINIFYTEDTINREIRVVEENLKDFDLNQIALYDLLDKYKVEKKALEKAIDEKLKGSKQNYSEKIMEIISKIADKENLDISEARKDKDFVFTSDLKMYSGAILQKLAVSFKVAILKTVEEKLGEELIFVMDSPRTRELDESNSKKLFEVILKFIKNTQLFVGSIYEYEGLTLTREIVNKAIEEKPEDIVSIFD